MFTRVPIEYAGSWTFGFVAADGCEQQHSNICGTNGLENLETNFTHINVWQYIMQTLCTTAGLCIELSIRAFPIRLHTLIVRQTWHINALVSTTLQIFINLNCAWGWKVRVRVCETCTCDICIESAVCEAQHEELAHDCDDEWSSACYRSAENLSFSFSWLAE